jgi:hypothetical protein
MALVLVADDLAPRHGDQMPGQTAARHTREESVACLDAVVAGAPDGTRFSSSSTICRRTNEGRAGTARVSTAPAAALDTVVQQLAESGRMPHWTSNAIVSRAAASRAHSISLGTRDGGYRVPMFSASGSNAMTSTSATIDSPSHERICARRSSSITRNLDGSRSASSTI